MNKPGDGTVYEQRKAGNFRSAGRSGLLAQTVPVPLGGTDLGGLCASVALGPLPLGKEPAGVNRRTLIGAWSPQVRFVVNQLTCGPHGAC